MTPNDIKHFAVSYEAFWDALRATERGENEWNALRVWSRLLDEAQITVGVEIIPQATLHNHMARAIAEDDKIKGLELVAEKARERAQDAEAEIATSR